MYPCREFWDGSVQSLCPSEVAVWCEWPALVWPRLPHCELGMPAVFLKYKLISGPIHQLFHCAHVNIPKFCKKKKYEKNLTLLNHLDEATEF